MDKKTIVLEKLKDKEQCSIVELARLCEVSLPTMRKLLTRMHQENLLQFHRGWARPNSKTRKDILNEFLVNRYEEKNAIGRRAASLVKDSETIFLGGGSTVSFMIPHLAQKQNLTVITNSIFTIQAALEYSHINLICTGGIWSEGSLSFLCNMPQNMKNVFPNKIFLSAVAVDCERGLSQRRPQDPNDEYQLDIPGSEVYYLIDSSKFDKSYSWQLTPAKEIRNIITDFRFPASETLRWQKRGITVHVSS